MTLILAGESVHGLFQPVGGQEGVARHQAARHLAQVVLLLMLMLVLVLVLTLVVMLVLLVLMLVLVWLVFMGQLGTLLRSSCELNCTITLFNCSQLIVVKG